MEDDQRYLRKLMEQHPNRLKQQSSSATLDTAFVHGELVPGNNPQSADSANHNTNGNNNNHNNGDEFPPGYRFCPLDGELIVHYLRKRIKHEDLPHGRIKDVNLYQANPAELSANYEPVGDKEWYFFTPRDRKYRNGNRPNRAAGTGYWKATGADKPVRYNGDQVGYRKALVFYEGRPPKGEKTNWIMHEYTTNGPPRTRKNSNDMRLDDWVLCRIYHKDDKAIKNHRRNQEPERVQCPTLNNNDQFAETDSVHNGLEDLSEPMNTYGDIHQPGYPNAFPGQDPHLMKSSFVNLANPNNGGFQKQFIPEARPINMMPPHFSGGSALRSKYLEESIWDSNARAFQETFWGSRNPYNFQASSEFDITSMTNYIDPYLNLDNIVGNNPADDALSIVSNNPLDDPLDIVRDNPPDDDDLFPSMPTED